MKDSPLPSCVTVKGIPADFAGLQFLSGKEIPRCCWRGAQALQQFLLMRTAAIQHKTANIMLQRASLPRRSAGITLAKLQPVARRNLPECSHVGQSPVTVGAVVDFLLSVVRAIPTKSRRTAGLRMSIARGPLPAPLGARASIPAPRLRRTVPVHGATPDVPR